jgi:hypothetical protein
MENIIKIISEFPRGLPKHSVVSWIVKISIETCCLIFSVEGDFFGVSCVEPSESVAVSRVNGLQVTSVEDNLSTLFYIIFIWFCKLGEDQPEFGRVFLHFCRLSRSYFD